MTDTGFIDWVRMYQPHKGEHPVVAGNVRVCQSLEGDRELTESYGWRQHRGSFDTNLNLRSDGRYVEMSGNVGRWGRPDNVFNLDWDETVEAANRICSSYGLPVFSAGEKLVRQSVSARDWQLSQKEGFDAMHTWTGARVSEIHYTRNFHTGSPESAQEWLNCAAGLSMARMRKGRLGDTTCTFGRPTSTHQLEVYIKAPEMLANAKNDLGRARIKKSEIYQWCLENGTVRIELKAKRGFLRDRGMNYLGGVTMGKLASLFDAKAEFLLDLSPERRMRLLENFPKKLRGHALNWMCGADMRDMLSRAQYFRVAKQLRECGIDISERRESPLDPNQALDAMLSQMPRFELRPARAPEWYDAAADWGRAA